MARKRRGRGEGSIFQRADGRWAGEVSLGYTEAGKRNRVTVYDDTKKGVQDQLDELRAKAKAGTLPDAGALTVGQLLDRWLAATADKHEVRTREERERLIRNHLRPRVGSVRLARLNALHVEGLYADLRDDGVGATTVRGVANLLGAALKHAVRLRLIPANPAAEIPKPAAGKREMLFLDGDQVDVMLTANHGATVNPLLAAALGSGCRQGELLGLSWPDVDLKAGTLTVRRSLSLTRAGFVLKEPKTAASRRTVALPPFAVEALTAHKARALKAGLLGATVFCTRNGNYVRKGDVRRAFLAAVKRANRAIGDQVGGDVRPLPAGLRFHDLRHTVASLLLSSGHSLRAVSQRLGHANPSMTLTVYAHCLPTDDAKLAEGLERLMTRGVAIGCS